jgi:hypothetical protein
MKMRNAVRMAVFSAAFAGFATAANAQAVQFFAVLDGGNEVSGNTANVGDLNGNGVASILLGASGQLCFSLLVRGINTPTAAHIHSGAPGQTGGILVTLTPRPMTGNPGSSSGCLSDVDTMVIAQIRSNPGRFYVNVHTGTFPNGAIRGNLF